jgi:non-homologous end joining protein Ku
MPPLRTGLLSFGLVSIPVQLHTATKDQHIAFHLLHESAARSVSVSWIVTLSVWNYSHTKYYR